MMMGMNVANEMMKNMNQNEKQNQTSKLLPRQSPTSVPIVGRRRAKVTSAQIVDTN